MLLLRVEADDAVTRKKEDKAAVAVQEQAFVRRVIDLHDKYYAYISSSFKKDNIFHQALKEAFEVFCNKKVCNNLVAELLSTFSDGVLRKGGSNEKLGD
uniref:Cullin n=1 Tax=Papaver somniferum TaxID=3469 RepID=A0A5B7LL27_PAPSO|nr:cullin [Papaver somniferum]